MHAHTYHLKPGSIRDSRISEGVEDMASIMTLIFCWCIVHCVCAPSFIIQNSISSPPLVSKWSHTSDCSSECSWKGYFNTLVWWCHSYCWKTYMIHLYIIWHSLYQQIIPVTTSRVVFDETQPFRVVATQVYEFSSDDVTSGITNVLLFVSMILLGNDPDSIIQW